MWVFSDAHIASDQRHGRESLADAIRQSESPSGFAWDIALDLGDLSGAEGTPNDPEGKEIVRQFGALKQHRREDIYDLSGNHDRSGLDEPEGWWWRKWVDPTGEHTGFSRVDPGRRPFAIEGTWERYSFRAGNLLFLMMSDINEPTQKAGRGPLGGNPGGVVRGDTFRWWKRLVEDNPSSIIITAHHYVLKNTTVASGEWEGMRRDDDGTWKPRYHGYFAHLTKYHPPVLEHRVPRSWLLTFTEDSDKLTARCYLHDHEHAAQGWYGRVDNVITLSKPSKMSHR